MSATHTELTRNPRDDLTSVIDDVLMSPYNDKPTLSRRRIVVYSLAIVGIAGAVLDFAVASENVQQHWLFGVLILVAAWPLLAWAIAAFVRPSRLRAPVTAAAVRRRAECGLDRRRAGRSGRHSGSATGTMPGMNMSGPAASSIKLATTSPAGDITMPDTNMQMMPGMKMASSVPCTATPTKAQENAAVSMVNASWKGASKYQSLAAAKAAGYVPLTPTGKHVVHYINRSYYAATVMGGPVLNYTDPQSLVYANTPKGAVLVAAMYITSRGGPTPQPGGCLTQWHVHTNLCLSAAQGVVGGLRGGNSTCRQDQRTG